MLRRFGVVLGLILLVVACTRPSGSPGPTAEGMPNATVEEGSQGPSARDVEVEPTSTHDPLVVKQFIQQMEQRGIETAPIDTAGVRVEYCLDTPCLSYKIAGGTLHVFLYPGEQAARLAAQGVPPNADCGPMDYAKDVRYFLYGRLIVLLGSEDRNALNALEDLAGQAFACGPGPGPDWASSCPD